VNVVRARRAAALAGLPLWVSLRRTRPVSDDWGFDRGTPIDRFYFDDFLGAHRADVRGDVLEIKSSEYTRRFGGEGVTEHVLDLDAANEHATLIADLDEPGSLPPSAYDCFILMQTLQLIRHPEHALANAWTTLRPGGTLLLTVPAVSKVERSFPDRWRFMPDGVTELLDRACPGAEADVRGYGNVLACVGFLLGLAAQEVRTGSLRDHDPDFPLVVCARVRKT
jgi:SAM-dependent methyltransferase